MEQIEHCNFGNSFAPIFVSCLNCRRVIENAKRKTKKFCCDACRKAYFDRKRKMLYGTEIRNFNRIMENIKILETLYGNGVRETSLKMMEKIGFNLNVCFVPSVNKYGEYLFQFSIYRLTVIVGNDNAKISRNKILIKH